jgi:hypothetical protein
VNVVPLASASFWIDTGERAVRAFAQGTLTALGIGSANHFVPDVSVPWPAAFAAGGIAAMMSVLMSLASIKVPGSDPDSGSFLPPPKVQAAKFKAWWRSIRAS